MSVHGTGASSFEIGWNDLIPGIEPPKVEKRELLLIEGGDSPITPATERTLRLFVTQSGGSLGRVVIVPATAHDPLDCGRRYARSLVALGAGLVQVLHIATRDHANDDNAAALLAQATGVLITGSHRAELMQLLDGTRALQTIQRRQHTGCVIATTKAGAHLLARQSESPSGFAAVEM
ncbi:MAG TPA: Type 1 glutamine amidotransferase-like domain-containing protein [Thermomicrobiales bacterium]|nr:Type 1 glutamine amidotransferase-like domain-containing protein [Thermomicrobiales bacterium]